MGLIHWLFPVVKLFVQVTFLFAEQSLKNSNTKSSDSKLMWIVRPKAQSFIQMIAVLSHSSVYSTWCIAAHMTRWRMVLEQSMLVIHLSDLCWHHRTSLSTSDPNSTERGKSIASKSFALTGVPVRLAPLSEPSVLHATFQILPWSLCLSNLFIHLLDSQNSSNCFPTSVN